MKPLSAIDCSIVSGTPDMLPRIISNICVVGMTYDTYCRGTGRLETGKSAAVNGCNIGTIPQPKDWIRVPNLQIRPKINIPMDTENHKNMITENRR
jgi:hypothetical protein